jgi:glycyl-tRNA synthetase beta chain
LSFSTGGSGRIASRVGWRQGPALGGRVGSAVAQHSTLLDEVPDLIEYPTVMAGTFSREFLSLPEEVLTTTMIHHQHNFPVVDEAGRLKPAFLVVTNTDAGNEKNVARTTSVC